MKKYRFKTEEEFKQSGLWLDRYGTPKGWNDEKAMNKYIGQEIPDEHIDQIESNENFYIFDSSDSTNWVFQPQDVVLNQTEEEKELETQKILNQINSLKTKKMKKTKIVVKKNQQTEKFVFMDKTVNILNVGFSTCKNVILYGPGGHGKSEIALDFLQSRGIQPYIITMGTGMTTDRLFGGLDIPTFEKTGKIEYLVENSFMNHEYVIFEELFDAPDFILEQLKDILSSGVFRNGTQIYPINTKFIICCTNRTRDEFSKNMSLKALMERFPLELNVIWDNYTEISYNKLLESKFGADNVDPVIPYLLQEYAKNGITISPRVAVTAYSIYEQCGPDALAFIAEFAKKPSLISEAIKKFESTIKFRELSSQISSHIETLNSFSLSSEDDVDAFKKTLSSLKKMLSDIKGLSVNDDIANMQADLIKAGKNAVEKFEKNLTIASVL
jgi:MoxR-like ATPase